MRPLTDSTDIQNDVAKLRGRAATDGYLLIRGLLPRQLLEDAGTEVAQTMTDAGWVPPSEPLATAKADLSKFCVEPQPPFMDVFYKQLSLRSLHALKQHEKLTGFFRTLFGEEVFCPPHFVMRLVFPYKDAYATPAHQDYTHFEGSRRNWAAWIPFTDIDEARAAWQSPRAHTGVRARHASCSRRGADGHRRGSRFVRLAVESDAHGRRSHPQLPDDPQGLPNTSGAMRVSMDSRYQPLSEPVGEKYLGVSHQMRTWEDLYADWEDDDPLKFYWHGLDLTVEPFTFHWYDRRDERAIEMGEAGDSEALVALENITLKHRSATVRGRAEAALSRLRAALGQSG